MYFRFTNQAPPDLPPDFIGDKLQGGMLARMDECH
jgi:hypothetical protein